VIDRPALIAWRSKAPWPNPVQIEQDLLLSRLMIEIARDEVLGTGNNARVIAVHRSFAPHSRSGIDHEMGI
jgi:hypothetical protein